MTSKLQAIKETVERITVEASAEKWTTHPSLREMWLNLKKSELFPDLLRLAEELEARLSVAETALSGLSDAVTLRLAHPSAKEARLRLWEAHKQATAALAEIRVTPPPDRKDGGIPNEMGLGMSETI